MNEKKLSDGEMTIVNYRNCTRCGNDSESKNTLIEEWTIISKRDVDISIVYHSNCVACHAETMKKIKF